MSHESLYEALLGERFVQLDEPVRRFHRLAGRHELRGWVQTQAPAGRVARLLGWALGTPLSDSGGALRFQVDAQPRLEQWTRCFPTRTMSSSFHVRGRHLVERLGPVRLSFELEVCASGTLALHLRRMHLLGLPCPRWALPRVIARERGDADRLHFEVRAALPLVGQVAAYAGHLDLDPTEECPS